MRLVLSAREVHALKSARFRSLIDKTWDLIVVAEADLRVAYITPSSERVLGYAAEELEGRPFTDLVHPDDSAVLIEQLTGLPEDESDAAIVRGPDAPRQRRVPDHRLDRGEPSP